MRVFKDLDELTAAVGETDHLLAAQHLGQPARQIAADHIPVARRADPACDESERDRVIHAEPEQDV